MTARITAKEAAKLLGLAPKRHKYGAKPTVIDGRRFSSKKEAKRYGELLLLQSQGLIRELECQPEFHLHARSGDLIGLYVADFSYWDERSCSEKIEDVKGYKRPLYRWKKKHCELEYGITITEI